MQGDVVQAMELANDMDPTMLDRDRCVWCVVGDVTNAACPQHHTCDVSQLSDGGRAGLGTQFCGYHRFSYRRRHADRFSGCTGYIHRPEGEFSLGGGIRDFGYCPPRSKLPVTPH